MDAIKEDDEQTRQRNKKNRVLISEINEFLDGSFTLEYKVCYDTETINGQEALMRRVCLAMSKHEEVFHDHPADPLKGWVKETRRMFRADDFRINYRWQVETPELTKEVLLERMRNHPIQTKHLEELTMKMETFCLLQDLKTNLAPKQSTTTRRLKI